MNEEMVVDNYSLIRIRRPVKSPKREYDFDFKKEGESFWRYLNSADTIKEFEELMDLVGNGGGSLAHRGG
jgi:hypothetical protein